MAEEPVHVLEDRFHRLQEPVPAKLTDDDIANAASVLLWRQYPPLHGRVSVAVQLGHAVLVGTVDSAEQRNAVEALVRGVEGVVDVANNLELVPGADVSDASRRDEPSGGIGRQQISGEPMVYVTRYCGIEASSLTAATEDAIETLNRCFLQAGLPVPEDVVVVYRNRLPETVVVDVGFVIPDATPIQPDDEIQVGRTPEGTMISAPAEHGAHGVFPAHDLLLEQARLADLSPMSFAWQRFPLEAARLKADRPVTQLYLPVQ